jgi:hypothetical protein
MSRVGTALLLVLLLAAAAVPQAKPREVDLTIDGIGSGSPFADALVKFGVASKKKIEKEEAEDSCLGRAATFLTLDYPGLQVVLTGDEFAQGFQIIEMTITSKKWNASGARIGDSPASVEKRFGKPNSIEKEGGATVFFYVTRENLGFVRFEFAKGKLTLMSMKETLC